MPRRVGYVLLFYAEPDDMATPVGFINTSRREDAEQRALEIWNKRKPSSFARYDRDCDLQECEFFDVED